MSRHIEASTSAKLFLRDDQDRVLLLRRSEKSKRFKYFWDLPGGKLDPGESPNVALRRELEEETGLACDALTFLGDRDFDIDETTCRESLYCAHLVGPADIRLSDEHDDYCWVALESLRSKEISMIPGLARFAQECKGLHNVRF